MTGTKVRSGTTGKRIVAIAIAVIGTGIVHPGITTSAIRTMTSETGTGVTNIRAEEAEAVVTTAGMISAIGETSTTGTIGKIATAVEMIVRIRETTTAIAITEDLHLTTERENPARINRKEDLAREASLQL